MKKVHLIGICALLLFSAAYADDAISKKVYSFNAEDGTPVFTDKQPLKSKAFKTHTIEVTGSTVQSVATQRYNHAQQPQNIYITQTQKVITEHKGKKGKKIKSKKNSFSRCQSYKEKLEFYTDKMRSGYKGSEYKKLEKNRKKYRKLLFSRCETKTFSD
jgi:hypothetical protein